MTPEWLSSPGAFKRSLKEQRVFDSSLGLTQEVADNYQRLLFAGRSREDALQEMSVGLKLENHVTWNYVHDALGNLPGPGEV